MTAITEFDPLKAKAILGSEVAILAMKRELNNILDSYVGWYDPFCELIQNALDALEERTKAEESYSPIIKIVINLNDNSIIVTDNGIGLTKDQYKQFLAPNFSFKSGNTRGHKGVGATYLAYGFNLIQVSTKRGDFHVTGKMEGARFWLNDENPAGNPTVCPDPIGPYDNAFKDYDSGVSIYLKLDNTTYPGDLKWLKADTADQWYKILSVKTGLGAFFENNKIQIQLSVIDSDNNETSKIVDGISFCWPHELVPKAHTFRDLKTKAKELYEKKGKDFTMPSAMRNLDAIYDKISYKDLIDIVRTDESENKIIRKYHPSIYFCYTFSAKTWPNLTDRLTIRLGISIFSPGIQIAANNMPQGELIQIPLKRNVGRQNQILAIIHFDNCHADLGRKGFQKEVVDFSKSISRKLIEQAIQPFRYTLRPVTGVKGDLVREEKVAEWKEDMELHEKEHPLILINENFFLPTKRISITSVPTREQDVIALFNQLIAGGVIRGIRIMSTNERFTYDGMYKVVFEPPTELHTYDSDKNPLGVLKEYVDDHPSFLSKPKILEYKYSLDALIEDLASGDKNSNDIDLVVAWETGEDYKGNYHITSLLDEDNLSERQYHGVTHVLTNITTGQKEMDFIALEELISHLENREESIRVQKKKYED